MTYHGTFVVDIHLVIGYQKVYHIGKAIATSHMESIFPFHLYAPQKSRGYGGVSLFQEMH